MALTVNQSWKMRKKIVSRPRTYEQALAIYRYSEEVTTGSTVGGYHHALGEAHVRQLPLVVPYWSRTYVGMLPTTVNSSNLDHTMYTNNDQVPTGRIAFYYAPSGGWNVANRTALESSLELVLWLPDGRCLINPAVMETFQWGRRYRAESFSDVSLWTDRQQDCVRTKKDAEGHVMSLWHKFKWPLSKLRPGVHRHDEIKDDDGNSTGMYWKWGKNYNNVYLWNGQTPLIIPKNRRQRPYLLRGVADSQHPGGTAAEAAPRLTSWAENRQTAKQRAAVHRKMAGLMRTLHHSPEQLRYFTSYFRNELGLHIGDSPPTTARAPVAQPVVQFLDAGSRHKRRVLLDEQ